MTCLDLYFNKIKNATRILSCYEFSQFGKLNYNVKVLKMEITLSHIMTSIQQIPQTP